MGYGNYSSTPGDRIGNATHDETVKAWTEGRALNGSRMFSDGETIYSYGRHFPIARLFEHEGKAYALFTTRDYSVTTSGHKSHVAGAARRAGIELIHSDNMRLGADMRRIDALEQARGALQLLHDCRLSCDPWRAGKADAREVSARRNAEMCGGIFPELQELLTAYETAREVWTARTIRLFGSRTAKAWTRIFGLHGVTGEFIACGNYMVPNYKGDLERRLCAYWRASDGRPVRITGSAPDFDVQFLDSLPNDLAAGV